MGTSWEPIRYPPRPLPIVVPESDVDLAHATRSAKGIPVWVWLRYDDGSEDEVMAFASAWTRRHVLVDIPWHYEYYTAKKDAWVPAAAVRRRTIEPGRW